MTTPERELRRRAWAEVLECQNRRRRSSDAWLPSMSEAKLAASVDSALNTSEELPVIASIGAVPYACALPGIEVRDSDDDSLAYFEERTGTVQGLGLRDDSSKAMLATSGLLRSLRERWLLSGATGAKLLWPTAEPSIESSLRRFGIIIDAYVEYLPGDQSIPQHGNLRSPDLTDLSVRRAQLKDFDAALAVHTNVLETHIQVSPFARQTPSLAPRYWERFKRAMSAQAKPLNGESLIFVAQYKDIVIGMSECTIGQSTLGLNSMFPPGVLGYIHSFGVLPRWRRAGVGQLLAQYSINEIKKFGVSGFYLLASHYNSRSVAFWETLGFRKMWNMYQSHDLQASSTCNPTVYGETVNDV